MLQPSQITRYQSEDIALKAYSCLACRQRKVKCDRCSPCSNCIKAKAQCSFVAPVRGKPRKRCKPKEGLHARLKRYEAMLKSYGVDIGSTTNTENDDVGSEAETASDEDVEVLAVDFADAHKSDGSLSTSNIKTKLVTKNGSSRYYENGLWPGLGDEFRKLAEENTSGSLDRSDLQTDDLFNNSPGTDESNLVLGGKSSGTEDLTRLHFPSHILEAMLDIYRERVDPLMKLLHLPTFWSTLTIALKAPRDISKSLEAVIFSFYLATIMSLEDDECRRMIGDRRDVMVARYQNAVRQSLASADFLNTSSLATLQAFAIFLMSMRGHFQSNSLYVLSGIAVRLARKMGLHRDGTMLGLSPFETELRRRLWWHIVQFDWRTADFSGTKPSADLFQSDTKRPSNIEDVDINPDTTSPPPERTGITPVVLYLFRCDMLGFLRKITPHTSNDVYWDNLTNSGMSLLDKDKLINQLEDMLQDKYVRYCDPLNSLHYFVSVLARASVCKMKLFAHNPRQFAHSTAKIPQSSRDVIFANGIKHLEYAALMHDNSAMRKYAWHHGTGHLWDTLHYVLVEVRNRKIGPDVDRAWNLVGRAFLNYPRIFAEATDILYTALGNWILRVWDDCVAARKLAGLPDAPAPAFVTAIRTSRQSIREARTRLNISADLELAIDHSDTAFKSQSAEHDGPLIMDSGATDPFEYYNLLSFDLEPDEWLQWDQLLSQTT